ncbi:MAG: hypothetical protein ACO4CT_08350 [Planctomycetota bacterium]
MGRTNWILAAMGLVACVALSSMMKQVLRVHGERNPIPAARAVDAACRTELQQRAAFRTETRGGSSVGVLTLAPAEGVHVPRRVARAGAQAGLTLGRGGVGRLFVAVESERFEVLPPWAPGPRVLRAGESASRTSAPGR